MQTDYIIVGGGSAGCVLANRLSENPNVHVTLVEAGGEDWNPLIHIPAGYIKTMVDPKVNWMFDTAPDARTADRKIAMPRGKVLGGSSAINAMLYVRGQAEDYDAWAARGNAGWSYLDVLPYFKKSENCQIASLQEPGDMQFVYNHSQLHDRTGFLDWPDPKERRHLMRLWLSMEGDRPLPDCYKERYGSIEVGNRGGIITKETKLHAPLD